MHSLAQRHDDWLLTPQRAAVHVPTATAVLADPHLGYDQARRQGGEALPAVSLAATLAALRGLALAYGVQRLVIAGDLVENARALDVVPPLLDGLQAVGIVLAGVVPGNHDRGLVQRFPQLPVFTEGIRLGNWLVVHGDGVLPRGLVVQGHVHPCVRLAGQTAPCYLVGRRRLVLPAFSTDAAGVNVLGQRTWSRSRCCVVAGERVLDFGSVAALHAKHRELSGKQRLLKARGKPFSVASHQ